MLASLRLYRQRHQQAFRKSWQMLWKKPVTCVMTVMVMAMIFLLPAFLWFVMNNMNAWSGQWKQSGHILLYLKPTLSAPQQQQTLMRVRSMFGVQAATMTTPAEGLSAMEQQAGMQGVQAYLADNPLPAVIEITPSGQLQSASAVQQLYTDLSHLTEVDTAQFDQDWMQRVYSGIDAMSQAAMGLACFLGFLVILIVSYTLRFVLQERREEIQVLTLVGAPFGYILRPFLYAGILYGLGGAIVCFLMLQGVMAYVVQSSNQWMQVYHLDYSLQMFSAKQHLILLMIALCLGWLGARCAVVRNIVFLDKNY